jgi:GxxExxY protein
VEHEPITSQIVDAAVKVHMRLGPGLLESAYEACLVHELAKRGIAFRQQVPMPVRYDELLINVGYRLDIVVEEKIILELKAVEALLPIHTAQLLSYLRLGDYRLGFLLNFHTRYMRDGIKRVVNSYQDARSNTGQPR